MATIFINEFHYTGTDNQFVEIAGPAGEDLSNYKIVLYDKTTREFYAEKELEGVIQNQDEGFGTVAFDFDEDIRATGAIALVKVNSSGIYDNLEQFLSYGGSFTASNQPSDVANNVIRTQTATDVNAVEPNSANGSLGVQGSGDEASDFAKDFEIFATNSKGAINNGQSVDGNLFTGGDNAAPEILDADLGPKVTIGSDIEITLTSTTGLAGSTEVLKKGTGNIFIKKLSDNSTVDTIDVTSDQVKIDDTNKNKIIIQPTNDLIDKTQYYIQIEEGAITDVAGNKYEEDTATSSADKSDLTFTAQDNAAPELESVATKDGVPLPKDGGATQVALNADLVFTFDEPVEVTTLSEIKLQQGGGNATAVTSAIADGNKVTIDLGTLTANADYTLSFGTGGLEDQSDAENDYGTDYTFKAATGTDVEVIDQNTATSATGTQIVAKPIIDLDTDLVITFNGKVEAVAGGDINIRNADGSLFEKIAIEDATISGNTVTLNPSKVLEKAKTYTVQIDPNTIKESDSTTVYDQGSTVIDFSTAADIDAPELDLKESTPENGATSVPLDNNLVIKFDDENGDDVEAGEGKIFIKSTDDSDVREFDVTASTSDGTVSVNTNGEVTINPTNSLEAEKTYFVEIGDGAIVDEFGNKFAGISGTDAFSFTTAKTEAPEIVSLSPTDNATNVPVDGTLVVEFNEDVKIGASGNITIFKEDGTSVESFNVGNTKLVDTAAAEGKAFVDGNKITINPTAILLTDTNYYVQFQDGAIIADDTANGGNADTFKLTDSTKWNFTTARVTAPQAIEFSPSDNPATADVDESENVAVDANLTITFNEEVKKGDGNIVIFNEDDSVFETIDVDDSEVSGQGTKTITINSDMNLEADSSYYVQIEDGAIEDVGGEAFGGISDKSFAFKTAPLPDTTAPVLTGATSPADNGTDVAVDANISFNLGEDVTAVAGKNITITDEDGNVTTIAADDAQVSIANGVVTINPTADLMSGKAYTVAIESGAFVDAAGLEFDGTLASDGTFNFTTVVDPTTPPVTPPVTPPTPPTTPTPINDTDVLEGGTNSGDVEVLDFTNFAGQVTADYTIEREAAFNNSVYFFTTDDANGTIDGIAPTAGAAYLSEVADEILSPKASGGSEFSVSDLATEQGTVTFAAGATVAPLIVIDGDINDALAGNAEYYVPFLGSSGDSNFDHIRLSGSTFEFEDAPSIDQDFDDITISFSNFQNVA